MLDLRDVLKFMNMRKVSEVSGVSYDVLKNYSSYRKEHLSDEDFNAVLETLEIILGGLK